MNKKRLALILSITVVCTFAFAGSPQPLKVLSAYSETSAAPILSPVLAMASTMTEDSVAPGCRSGFSYNIWTGQACSGIGLTQAEVMDLIRQYAPASASASTPTILYGGTGNGVSESDFKSLSSTVSSLATNGGAGLFSTPLLVTVTATSSFSGPIQAASFIGDGSHLTGLTSSQWTTSGANIFYGGGNVGIGTASPNNPLTVNTNGYTGVRFYNNSVSAGGGLFLGSGADGNNLIMSDAEYNTNGFVARGTTASDIYFNGGYIQFRSNSGLTAGSGYGPISALVVTPTDLVGIGNTGLSAELGITPFSGTTTVLIVKGASGQTADLQDWQNSAGNILDEVTASGNIGIGTTTPPSNLTVVGSACISKGANTTAPCSTTAGTITANVFNTAAADLAEDYTTTDPSISAGDVVAVDPNNDESVLKATSDSSIMGVVSTQPGVLLGGGASTSVPVALAGRVPVIVSMENGTINRGDSITISSTPGVAMKANTGDPIIGTALQDMTTNGSLLVFVRPSFTAVDVNDATSAANVTITSSDPVTLLANALSTIREWVGQKVVAVEGIFNHIQTDTIDVAKGIQMKSPDGTTYCVTVANGGSFTDTPGPCGVSAPALIVSVDPVTAASTTDQTEQNATSTTTTAFTFTTTPDIANDTSEVATSTPAAPTQPEHTVATSTPSL
jgi:hypothetical protein